MRRDRRVAQREAEGGRNPRDAKVAARAGNRRALPRRARPPTTALADFELRARGGIPDDIPEVALTGAPLGIAQLLKQAGLAPSTSEALRNVEQGGVRIDGASSPTGRCKLDGRHVRAAGRQAPLRARHAGVNGNAMIRITASTIWSSRSPTSRARCLLRARPRHDAAALRQRRRRATRAAVRRAEVQPAPERPSCSIRTSVMRRPDRPTCAC